MIDKLWLIIKGLSIVEGLDIKRREISMNMTATLLTEFVSTINSGHWRHFYELSFKILFLCVIRKLFIELIFSI